MIEVGGNMNKSNIHRSVGTRQLASDNYAGICPEAWAAMAEANRDHAPSYGEDAWTTQACDLLRAFFERDCEIFFTFNGTAANAVVVATLCKPYHSFICHERAHIETDECGAPEFFSHGTKVLTVGGADGKLNLAQVEHLVRRRSDVHYPKPRAVSITQATELGTVYSLEETRAVGELARRLGLKLHIDGARLFNALATSNVAPREITWEAGADVLSLGAVKNGLAMGEAVVFFDRELAFEFEYRCKQAGQLCSKMRFVSAPWIGMLKNDTWRKYADNANRCAAMLEKELRTVPGLTIQYPVQSNAVFVDMPLQMIEALHARGWSFYTHIGLGVARLMCAWDTDETDIKTFMTDVRQIAQKDSVQ